MWKNSPTTSPEANSPSIGRCEVLITRALVSTCSPPKVKVMPVVTGYARNGGLTIGSAQLDLRGEMPAGASAEFAHIPS